MMQQEAVAQALEDQAVVSVECDVPIGWSLDDYRTARGLAREVMEDARPAWRRLFECRAIARRGLTR